MHIIFQMYKILQNLSNSAEDRCHPFVYLTANLSDYSFKFKFIHFAVSEKQDIYLTENEKHQSMNIILNLSVYNLSLLLCPLLLL